MTTEIGRAARRVEQHPLVERFAKAGLGSRAALWLLIGVLAASVALGGGTSQEADQSGALRAIGGSPGGTALLLLVAAGFAAYSAYRFLCAAVGHRHESRTRRVLHRLKSAGEGVIYGAAALLSLRVAMGSSPDSEQDTRSATATVMGWPGGRTLVFLIGGIAVVVAVVLFVRALGHHHAERLRGAPARWRRPLLWLGVAGLGGRSLAVALVGWFLADAALAYDPDQAKGLDAALDAVARQPFGQALLLLSALSLVAYGLWSLAEMRWRDV
ncbi:MAG TPA: DUF1206 domain-containing protein [Mycobacteriales bacterium]|nr:DUF1206 domain-containing protein [Mycobacteriales bacterium]